MNRTHVIFVGVVSVLLAAVAIAAALPSVRWSDAEIQELGTLWIGALEPLSPDPTNRVADDPRAAEFGRRLFFDTRLSSNGKVACATCHKPDQEFQDSTPLANGVGLTNRRTMPITATAYSPFLFWDGRKDSQWAQALGPLESPVEHGGTREQYAIVIADHYRADYDQIFGRMPELSTRDEATPDSIVRTSQCGSRAQPIAVTARHRYAHVDQRVATRRDPATAVAPGGS